MQKSTHSLNLLLCLLLFDGLTAAVWCWHFYLFIMKFVHNYCSYYLWWLQLVSRQTTFILTMTPSHSVSYLLNHNLHSVGHRRPQWVGLSGRVWTSRFVSSVVLVQVTYLCAIDIFQCLVKWPYVILINRYIVYFPVIWDCWLVIRNGIRSVKHSYFVIFKSFPGEAILNPTEPVNVMENYLVKQKLRAVAAAVVVVMIVVYWNILTACKWN